MVKKNGGKVHIVGQIRKSYTECGRVIAGAGLELLDPKKGDDLEQGPRVCKWCRITYEARP